MEVSRKVDEINESCMCAGGNPDAITDVAVIDLGNGAKACLEQGLFDANKEKADIANAHASDHDYIFGLRGVKREVNKDGDKFCQVEKSVSKGELIGSLTKEERGP